MRIGCIGLILFCTTTMTCGRTQLVGGCRTENCFDPNGDGGADGEVTGSDGSLGNDTGGDLGPLITWSFGENGTDSMTEVTLDTFLDEGDPSYNWGISSLLHSDGDAGSRRVVLLMFDLSVIPVTAEIVGAVLSLTTWGANPSVERFTIHQILESWDEGTAFDEPGNSNWTVRTMAGATWSAAGCNAPSSRSSTEVGEFFPDFVVDTLLTSTIDSVLIGGWVANPPSNFGFAIVTNGNDGGSFWGKAGPDGLRPSLEVTYR